MATHGPSGAQPREPRDASCRPWRIGVALVVIGLATLAIGVAPVASAQGTFVTLAKSYTGSAHNITASASGVITLSGLTQDGGAIAGTFAFQAPLVGTGPFRGTVTSTTIKFTVIPTTSSCPSCASIVFTGRVWPIVSMSGTWVAYLKSGGSQKGTWGVGSTWGGTLVNVTYNGTQTLTIGALTETANGDLVGHLYVSGTGGSNSGTLLGSLHGSVVKFSVQMPELPGGSFVLEFAGELSALGSMSGTWNGLGQGKWQLQRHGAQPLI